MQLGKFTDYGLRLMVHLAAVYPAKIAVTTIAETLAVSEHHLAKICAKLVKSGQVVSERGRTGGITLAADPSDIRLGGVVRTLTSGYAFVECDNANACVCTLMPACGLQLPLRRAKEAFYAELDKTTLQEVVADKRHLKRVLRL